MATTDELSGVRKAAILLIALGPERSAEIFKHLKEEEIEELTLEIANTRSVSPQVKEDVNFENGMGISMGRLREDKIYDYKFIGLSHNTVRGAAGGAILCAELLTAQGYISAK